METRPTTTPDENSQESPKSLSCCPTCGREYEDTLRALEARVNKLNIALDAVRDLL